MLVIQVLDGIQRQSNVKNVEFLVVRVVQFKKLMKFLIIGVVKNAMTYI